MPEPEQVCPAGQGSQFVRVSLSPPDVNDPIAQVEQAAAAGWEYLVPSAHFAQALLPAALKNPAPQVTMELVPTHLYPGVHVSHVVRVVGLPPEVTEPAAHVTHASAVPGVPLYRLSTPQSAQAFCPAVEKVPTSHFTCALEPEHLDPAVHAAHVWRVVELPPPVKLPGPHTAQTPAPTPLNMLSFPQGVQ